MKRETTLGPISTMEYKRLVRELARFVVAKKLSVTDVVRDLRSGVKELAKQ